MMQEHGGGGSDTPLYQLAQGTFASGGGTKTVTVADNHVTLGGTQYNNYWNLTNGTYGQSVHNNQSLWFTVPSGKTCTLKILNISAAGGFSAYIGINFRKANTTTSGSFGTGNFRPANNPDDIVVTKALSSSEGEGCLFIYMGSTSSGTAEFDVEFWVGTDRWL